MKISLRKANAIQNSINDSLKSIKISTTVDINEFEDPQQKIVQYNASLFDKDQKRGNLLMAQYTIRGLVGAANASSGIDSKLTKSAYIDKRIAQLNELNSAEEQTSIEVIVGKLDKIKNRKEDSRMSLYGKDDVTTSVLTPAQIKEVKNLILNLQKEKQKLNDEILELNVRTEIELPQEVIDVLQAENLV
jgi:hypothetical protein